MRKYKFNNDYDFRVKLIYLFHYSIGIVGGMIPGITFAHDVTVNISGTIHDNTCIVAPVSLQRSVTMGQIANKSFHYPGDRSSPVRFTIDLQNCGEGATGVDITLKGDADTDNERLLKLSGNSTARGIGVALQDDLHNDIAINHSSKTYPLKSGAKNVSIVFYAQYMATQDIVTAGEADSTATFELTYP